MTNAAAPTRRTLRYDPALDGLRALAVLSVMIYHGFIGWGRGGFLGVDLFFVLSGYLITTLMLLERESTGSISLGAFWYRRAKRLLPALFLVLGWVAIYAAIYAEPEQLHSLRRDALATLAYVANWNFIASGQSYFDAFSTPSPLRHMWSLAIEEQWYLLWPIAAGFGLRWFGPRRRVWPIVLVSLAVASAVAQAALAQGATDTSRAYYGTDVRAHALLLGAAMAFVMFRHRDSKGRLGVDHHWVQVVGWLGGAGLAAFFVLVDDTDRWMYNGGFFLAAIASAAIIAGTVTEGPHHVLRQLLALPPFPLIGRLSYGLYLWHWPLYVFLTPDRTGLEGYELFGVRVAASFAAAGASYVWMEQPLRRFHVTGRRMALGALGAIGAFATAMIMATATSASPNQPIATGVAVQPESALDTSRDTATRVMVVGDSVAFGFVNDLTIQTISSRGFRVQNQGRIGCGVFEGDYFGENVLANADQYNCDQRLDGWERAVATTLPDITVFLIGGYELFDWELDGERYDFGTSEYDGFVEEQLSANLDVVTASSGQAVFLTVQCMEPTSNGLGDVQAGERGELDRQRHFNALLERFVADNQAKATLIDLADYTCPDATYDDELEGVKLHRDGVHFTPEASALVWDWLATELASIAEAQ